MKNLVFFLEERSAKEMLKEFIPRLAPKVCPYYIPFNGKRDLETKKLFFLSCNQKHCRL